MSDENQSLSEQVSERNVARREELKSERGTINAQFARIRSEGRTAITGADFLFKANSGEQLFGYWSIIMLARTRTAAALEMSKLLDRVRSIIRMQGGQFSAQLVSTRDGDHVFRLDVRH